MANHMTDKAAFRIRRHYTPANKPKKYQATYELFDEQLQRIVVKCDLTGRAVFNTLTIIDENNTVWQMKPNRKFMPSRWLLKDGDGKIAWQFDQKIVGKLLNPAYKTVLVVLDDNENELLLLVNLHNKKAAVILGFETGKYALIKKDIPLAEFKSLPRQEQPEGKGIIGAVKRFFTATDKAIVSMTDKHPLPPPAALAIYLLFDELTDTSAA